jgi:RND family efflux transporter MFP subunit
VLKPNIRFLCIVLVAMHTSPVLSQTVQDYSSVGLDTSADSIRGVSQCKADLALSFAVSGVVAKTTVEEGDTVKKGDVLIELDQDIEAIEAQRRELIWENHSEMRAAVARRDVAKVQMEAAQRVYNSNSGISLEELQNRKLAFEISDSEVGRLETQKKMEHLDHLTALANVKRRTLLAPTVGIISNLIRKNGESAQANDPVLQLCDLSEINFVANIPIAQAEKMVQGQIVKLMFTHHDEFTEGRVTFVSPVVDPASGLRELKVVILDIPSWLRPGLKAELFLD